MSIKVRWTSWSANRLPAFKVGRLAAYDKIAVSTRGGLEQVVTRVLEALAKGGVRVSDAVPGMQYFPKSTSSGLTAALVAAPIATSMDVLMVGLLDRVVQLHEHGATDVTGVRTGFYDLDRMTAGFQPGDLIVVASRPAVGKTSLALNIAEHVAVLEGLPVLIFTMEMRAGALTQRITGSMARIDHFHMRIGALRDEDWQRFSEVAERLGQSPIFVDESPGVSTAHFRRVSQEQKEISGAIGLIVIDSLQLIDGMSSTSDSPQAEKILADLKRLAREVDCPVVVVSSLPRVVESRADKRPRLSDFVNSEAVEEGGLKREVQHQEW